MAIVYNHERLDNNDIFYIGIGAKESRAYSRHKRTDFWKKIVKKGDYKVNIIHKDITWEHACIIEKYLISFYGRIDLGTGKLCNLTNGGDGTFGRVCTNETKQKISIKAKDKLSKKENHPMYGRKQTDESNEKNRNSQLGQKSHMFGKRGDLHPMFGYKYSEEQIKKQIIRKSGVNNPNYGKRGSESKISKKVIAFKDGLYYQFGSLIEASNELNCHAKSISNCCLKKQYQTNGFRFKYLNDDSFIGEFLIKKRVLSEENKNKIRLSLLGKKRGKYASSHKSNSAENKR